MCAQKMMAMKVNNLTTGCKLKMIDRKPKDHFKCYLINQQIDLYAHGDI